MQRRLWIALATIYVGLAAAPARAQNEPGAAENLGACTLKNHIYTCDGAALQRALASASTAAIETGNVDGAAQSQLSSLIVKKLGKTLAAKGTPTDLVFLLVPTAPTGVVNSSGDVDLGTLRIYATTPEGARGPLLWAETFRGDQEMPWPAVVHGLILQFQSRFKIK
jgi:hypothetical protein